MARGSSNAPFFSDRMRKTWRNEAENDKITPRDHVPISKTYLLQQHRQMGVVKQDCEADPLADDPFGVEAVGELV